MQNAQETLDAARLKVQTNQSLAAMLLADTDRALADATTRMERIKRFIMVARAKQLSGRWPMVATRQRDDIDESANKALMLLIQAQEFLDQARSRSQNNPGLGEAIIADTSMYQAKALTQTERIVRLLTEAGLGRE